MIYWPTLWVLMVLLQNLKHVILCKKSSEQYMALLPKYFDLAQKCVFADIVTSYLSDAMTLKFCFYLFQLESWVPCLIFNKSISFIVFLAKPAVRQRWTDVEEAELRVLFQHNFTKLKCPNGKEIDRAMKISLKKKGVVHKRKPDNVKKKVSNMLIKLRRISEK